MIDYDTEVTICKEWHHSEEEIYDMVEKRTNSISFTNLTFQEWGHFQDWKMSLLNSGWVATPVTGR